MRAAMIGLGKLGCPVAEVMAEYHDIIGYDINPPVCNIPQATNLLDAIKGRELIFVAVPTPHDPAYGGEKPTSHLETKDFDYSIVTQVLHDIDEIAIEAQIIVLISTTLPGTVRRLASHLKNRLIYNPYLIAMGSVRHDMLNPEMIIIGTETGGITDDIAYADLLTLNTFYKPIIDKQVKANTTRYVIGTYEEAEAVKIFYNTYISMKLAFSNMIMDVAEATGYMNVTTVTNALSESTKRIMSPAYMTAGFGDSGPCHPRDLIALSNLSVQLNLGYDLFGSIAKIREQQAENMAMAALRYGQHVVILGKAYKPQVSYTAGSYSLLVGYYIEANGGQVTYYDPRTNDLDQPEGPDLVYLIAFHDDWTLHFPMQSNSVVLDPWRRYPTNHRDDVTVIHYGNTR